MLVAIAVAVIVTLIPLLRRSNGDLDDGFDDYFTGRYDVK